MHMSLWFLQSLVAVPLSHAVGVEMDWNVDTPELVFPWLIFPIATSLLTLINPWNV